MAGMDYGECLMHGFMFKKSGFYSKVPTLCTHAPLRITGYGCISPYAMAPAFP